MSDCFNHALDAFESMSTDGAPNHTREGYNFNYDPLYYHSKVEYISLVRESDGATTFMGAEKALCLPK